MPKILNHLDLGKVAELRNAIVQVLSSDPIPQLAAACAG
jgi:hypothetical protein